LTDLTRLIWKHLNEREMKWARKTQFGLAVGIVASLSKWLGLAIILVARFVPSVKQKGLRNGKQWFRSRKSRN
jgi:hypothetical protein